MKRKVWQTYDIPLCHGQCYHGDMVLQRHLSLYSKMLATWKNDEENEEDS